MKKVYETPTVDKIAFNYRDQVVAASGALAGDNGVIDTPSTGEQIISRIAEGLGWNICNGYQCTSLAELWA